MIIARVSEVGMPPGVYRLSTVLDILNARGGAAAGSGHASYKIVWHPTGCERLLTERREAMLRERSPGSCTLNHSSR